MSDISVEVRGLRELERRLQTLPDRLQRKALTPAVLAGARVVAAEARKNAPIRTGATRRNVIAKRARDLRGYAARALVGVRHGKARRSGEKAYARRAEDPWYFFMYERSGFHSTGRTRRIAARGRLKLQRLGVRSSGFKFTPPRPFIGPALKSAGGRAALAIRERLARELAKIGTS